MRGTKVDWGRKNVGKSDEHDRVCTRTEEDERVIKANASSRDTGPGGQLGEQGRLGDVEGDWKRWSDRDGVQGVENPGISHSDILILIPDSRTVYDLIFTLFILLTLSR